MLVEKVQVSFGSLSRKDVGMWPHAGEARNNFFWIGYRATSSTICPRVNTAQHLRKCSTFVKTGLSSKRGLLTASKDLIWIYNSLGNSSISTVSPHTGWEAHNVFPTSHTATQMDARITAGRMGDKSSARTLDRGSATRSNTAACCVCDGREQTVCEEPQD
jgi:hypothetical protein